MRPTIEELVERARAATKGLNAQQSHERAMKINREWLKEKEEECLTYAELGRRHGVSKEMARLRCIKAMEEKKA